MQDLTEQWEGGQPAQPVTITVTVTATGAPPPTQDSSPVLPSPAQSCPDCHHIRLSDGQTRTSGPFAWSIRSLFEKQSKFTDK